MPVLEHIVEQHAVEAAFLWLLRDRAAGAPGEDLERLGRLDDRVEAHLEGLQVAGDAGWELCRERLADPDPGPDPGEVFAAVSAGAGRLDEVLAACDTPERLRGAASALAWAPFDRDRLETLSAAPEPRRRWLAVAAMALHRRELRALLERAVADPDAGVRRRAYDAAGELGRRDLAPALVAAIGAEEGPARLAAAGAAALLGAGRRAAPALREAAEAGGPGSGRACELAARCLHPSEAAAWLRGLAEDPAAARRAVRGLGAAGDPAQLPWLIERMEEPALARAAGEALCRIAGLDLAAAGLAAPPPDGSDPGPSDDPADEAVAMDPDEGLPWPDREGVIDWWHREGSRLPAGVRHLGGRPVEPAALRALLGAGGQRLRAAAAVELAMLEPAGGLFEVRAPARRQLAELASMDGDG